MSNLCQVDVQLQDGEGGGLPADDVVYDKDLMSKFAELALVILPDIFLPEIA